MPLTRGVEDVLGALGGEDVTGRVAHRARRPAARDYKVLGIRRLVASPPELSDVQVIPCVEDLLRGALGVEDVTGRLARRVLRPAVAEQ